MKKISIARDCEGIGYTHVARDCDMAEQIGFYTNEYQIYYVLDGERHFYDEEHKYLMQRGTISFVDKERIPYTNVIGGVYHERILIEITETWMRCAEKAINLDLKQLFQFYHGVLLLEAEEQKVIESLLQEIEEICQADGKYIDAEIKTRVLQLLLVVAAGKGQKAPEQAFSKGKMRRYGYVREMIEYIIQHYNEVQGLEDLAGIYYMDKSYLSRNFKEVTNFTVNEYINCQRMGHAKEYLLNEELSMDEVAQKLGYRSLSYFDRVFKKYIGMTPLQYRNQKKKELSRKKV